jgi:hypothetical protein
MKRIVLVGVFLSGCIEATTDASSSGSPTSGEAARVFNTQKSTTITPRALPGIWESAQPDISGPLQLTSRFEFRASFVVIAARCTRDGFSPVVVGGRSAATVTDALIQTTEPVSDTKPIGSDAACQARSNAGNIPACDPNTPPVNRNVCFELTGTTLDIYQSPGVIVSFVKITD